MPVALRTGNSAGLEPTATEPSAAKLLFVVMLATGLLLVVASALPGYALRPTLVQEVVIVHRLDLALVGFSIVVIVGALYVLAS